VRIFPHSVNKRQKKKRRRITAVDLFKIHFQSIVRILLFHQHRIQLFRYPHMIIAIKRIYHIL